MKAFWAIVKLTFRNAIRSHIFQLLLLLLLLCVILIPGTVSGDGTARGFIRISLLYSLSAVSTILALSSVWLGCFVMTQDVDNYQLHMVVTKPVSRVSIWLAKWVGVNLIHLVLLAVATLSIYFIILYKYNQQEFSAEERERIRNEVLVGRRVFWPEVPDYDKVTRELVRQRIENLRSRGLAVDTGPAAQEKMFDDARRELVSAGSEVKHNTSRGWIYRNVPEAKGKPLFLRYRPYIGKVATEGQRMTRSWWQVGVPRVIDKSKATSVFDPVAQSGYEIYFYALSNGPRQVMSGEFHEEVIPPAWNVVTPDNTVLISYVNFDDKAETQYFQPADGPKLLVEVCGFFSNYLRAVLLIALELLILSGLGCAFGGFLSMPTAIFVVISYLLFGSFAIYMSGMSYISGAADQFAQSIAKVLLWIVIPLQAFEASTQVANGELLEWSAIWQVVWFYFLCRALPLFALGIYFYCRRELGLVIRK